MGIVSLYQTAKDSLFIVSQMNTPETQRLAVPIQMNPKVLSSLSAADVVSLWRRAVEELYTQTPFVVPSNLLAFYVRMFGFVRRFPVEVIEGKLKRLPYDNRTDTESTAPSCVPSAVKMS